MWKTVWKSTTAINYVRWFVYALHLKQSECGLRYVSRFYNRPTGSKIEFHQSKQKESMTDFRYVVFWRSCASIRYILGCRYFVMIEKRISDIGTCSCS